MRGHIASLRRLAEKKPIQDLLQGTSILRRRMVSQSDHLMTHAHGGGIKTLLDFLWEYFITTLSASLTGGSALNPMNLSRESTGIIEFIKIMNIYLGIVALWGMWQLITRPWEVCWSIGMSRAIPGALATRLLQWQYILLKYVLRAVAWDNFGKDVPHCWLKGIR